MAIDASHLLGSAQLAGVRVNPFGAMRRAEKGQLVNSGGVPVSGSLAVAIGDAIGGKKGAQQRGEGEQLAGLTPPFGNLGFFAVTDGEVALITTKLTGMSTVNPVEVIARRPRGDVLSAELAGGWPHIAYSIISAAPFRIGFADGSTWQMEVSRFSRKHGKRVVQELGG
jgi:hypothetical protein